MSSVNKIRAASQAAVQTVGATTATIASFDTAALAGIASVGFYVEGVLIARNAATGDAVSMKVARSLGLSGGTLSSLGSLGTLAAPLGSAALLTIVADIDVSAGVIRLRATGIALLTLDWSGNLTIDSGHF